MKIGCTVEKEFSYFLSLESSIFSVRPNDEYKQRYSCICLGLGVSLLRIDLEIDKFEFDGVMIVTFGERLYELRKKKNVSQEELAELLDVSRQSISKWENDKAYPEMTRLLFMSEYFDVSLDYLMRGVEGDENNENTIVSYKAKNMLMIWNSFVSNLSDKQRNLLMVLYVLLICVFAAIVVSFIYGVGYAIGQLIGNIQNDLTL